MTTARFLAATAALYATTSTRVPLVGAAGLVVVTAFLLHHTRTGAVAGHDDDAVTAERSRQI